ncbi:UDP-glycosyltransferase superfamily protein, putative [Medicago truncatula]|uniref:UDP-glycosyltransferase superfamily protein, putative n=1 Tax=Medicago truncatula TaxID=3880 RepID=A0A072TVP9_MEDTR|nr:UDP-glycosyltransferase superfamily protein, putative [Medicago truncatula]
MVRLKCPLIMLLLQNEQGLIARVLEEKIVGVKVTKNEYDEKFSMESLDKALRSVMQKQKERFTEVKQKR